MDIEGLKAAVDNIYKEAIDSGYEAVEGIKSVQTRIVDGSVEVTLDAEILTTWSFYLRNGKPYDENGLPVDFSSVEAFFMEPTHNEVTLRLTADEAEVLKEYVFRKVCKLKDAGLEDSKCYPLLLSAYYKLKGDER